MGTAVPPADDAPVIEAAVVDGADPADVINPVHVTVAGYSTANLITGKLELRAVGEDDPLLTTPRLLEPLTGENCTGRFVLVPSAFYPETADTIPGCIGFIGRIVKRGKGRGARHNDPICYDIMFLDGGDSLYHDTKPEWPANMKHLAKEGVQMLS